MESLFIRYWWVYLLRGILAILLGLLALFMPIAAFTALVIYVGAYMFIEGVLSAVVAIRHRQTYRYWGWLLIVGLLGIAAGVLTLLYPFATGTLLIAFVAVWALIIGIAEIVWAIRLRKEITGERWYIFSGILSIVFGLTILLYPVAGAITLAFLFGFYALIIGILLVSLALRLRNKRSRTIPVT